MPNEFWWGQSGCPDRACKAWVVICYSSQQLRLQQEGFDNLQVIRLERRGWSLRATCSHVVHAC